MHNPTVGGHFAISVQELDVITAKLEAAGIPYSDAGVYAMNGVRQIYVYDPSFNIIEINQTVTPLPAKALAEQDTKAGIHLRHAAIPSLDIQASIAFFQDIIGLGAPAAMDAKGAVFRNQEHAIKLAAIGSGYADDKTADPADSEPYFTLALPDPGAVQKRLEEASLPSSGIVKDPIDGKDSLFVHAPSLRLMAIVQL